MSTNIELKRKRITTSTKWSYVRSNAVPASVTIRQTSTPSLSTNIGRGVEIVGSALRPAANPSVWYEVIDRSQPSISSF